VCWPSKRGDGRDTPRDDFVPLQRIELQYEEYRASDTYTRKFDMDWLTSLRDVPSAVVLERFEPMCFKIASACLADDDLPGGGAGHRPAGDHIDREVRPRGELTEKAPTSSGNHTAMLEIILDAAGEAQCHSGGPPNRTRFKHPVESRTR
jgi:hypothetical protein